MTEDRERPFGVALVAAWFVLGAIVLYVLAAIALVAIAANIWRERPRVRGVACLVLAATAVVAVWRATTPWHWGVAAINVAAVVYLLRYRARSM